jgi:2'-phosphotransferase
MPRNDRGTRGGSGGNREVQISKALSWLLRHGAEKEGLKLGSGGFLNLKDVVGLAEECFNV